MSDVSQGPGWWQASDGKWYPPEQASGAQPTPPPSGGQGFPQQGQGGGAPGFGGLAPTPGTATGPGGAKLAEWPERVIATLIELAPIILISIIFYAVSFALGSVAGIIGLGWWIYNGMLNGTTGQSIGKKITGLRVVDMETGQPIGSTNGIMRAIYHIVDSVICYIGWLFPLWDAQKQTIADKIAKTVVLTDQQKHEVNAELFKS